MQVERSAKYGTQYLETEAILAAQEDDTVYLDQLLAQLGGGALERMRVAAGLLNQRISIEAFARRAAALREEAHGVQ